MNAYRTFARSDDRDLTLADVDLGIGRAWLADFVERGCKPATVAVRARALRVFSHWIVTEDYVRSDSLARLKVPTIPRIIVETFTIDQMSGLVAAAPTPLAITLRIFLDAGVRLNEATGLRNSDVGDGQLRILGKGDDSGPSPTAGPWTRPAAAT
jgi:integrase/recombinase XerC